MATGIVNAGGSFGQFVMAPIAGALMVSVGWGNAMQVMAGLVLLALPAAFFLKGNNVQVAVPGVKSMSTGDAVRLALRTPSFLLLATGFFVCGFHVAFLATHLPGVVAACGLPTQWGAWALGILGLFNIVGSIAMGWAVGRWRMKSLLSLVYAVRAVAVIGVSAGTQDRPGGAGVCGSDGRELLVHRAAHRRLGRQVLWHIATWPRCLAW